MDKRVQIPGELLAAIKTRSEREVGLFFDNLAQQAAMEVTGVETIEGLWQNKAKVKTILEMKQFFLTEMQRK